MEIKREPKIKSMKYEDFNDNEYLEKMVAELRDNNTNVIVGCLDELFGILYIAQALILSAAVLMGI